nr:unnamed protein product [Digitaria exilis]
MDGTSGSGHEKNSSSMVAASGGSPPEQRRVAAARRRRRRRKRLTARRVMLLPTNLNKKSFGYKGSILSPYGEQWKKMRRVMTSEILSPALERRLHTQRAEEADHLVRFVYNQCNDTKANNGVDIRHVARHFCGDMIRRLVFSKRYFVEPPLVSAGAGPGPNEVVHVDALFTLVNCVYSFCISDYFPVLRGGLDLDGHEKVVHGVMETLNRLHDPIIEERIHEWSILRKHGEKREIQDFLDVLVSLEDSEGQALLSFEEIKAQAAEIMFAIVDNPSNAVEWALAEMMNKPEVMEKAMKELNAVVGKERLVQESDIPRLNYLKSCIREAFRLHPYHAFNVPHVAMKDTTLSGYMIPKDSHVIISRLGLGRNPNTWAAPLEFQPERHLSGSSDVLLTEPDLRFISFSTGRRGCPGVSLGSSVTMMLFARLLQGFAWTKLPGVRAIELKESTTSLALSEPLTLQAEPRFGYKGSILSPYGEQWKKMRRVMTSEILSPALERRLHTQRAEEADHLVRFVYNQCNDTKANNGVDIRHVARHFCGDMIRRLVFSKRYFVEPPLVSAGAGPGPNEVVHVDALFTLVNCVYSFCISDYFPVLRGGLDLDGHEKVVHGVMETLNRLHDPIIEERIHEWSILRKHGEKREIQDFLDVLVSLEDSEGQALLSFEEIKAQAAEIMFAIVDNPSNAVEWALAEMMNKPEVMEKAMKELNAVVGKERLVQESDIPRLNYLKSCIREAFRLHPYHAFNVPHVAMKDTTLSGYMIPKDSHVIISRLGLGRNPNTWAAPLEFQPERHLSGSSDVLLTEPDLRFISFSTGRRGCPGVSLGSSVTMMLFARLLQGFAWTKLPGVRAIELKESTTSLALSEPLTLQAEPRLPVHLYESISS